MTKYFCDRCLKEATEKLSSSGQTLLPLYFPLELNPIGFYCGQCIEATKQFLKPSGPYNEPSSS